ncbi:hypothetical protein DZ860_06515 [Vibrio sinensis]|uniref:Chitin-binding type-2 domain-containing protein n=1 Tax=Vibrio sinensis TaxID=2302434 RepID=A0A3A6QQC5_9VIBR|nr:hypothetical protein [Vibrio sinensis]RJX72806.1 hypothetical protein DZ860_06515 [Vibrio sinensis]
MRVLIYFFVLSLSIFSYSANAEKLMRSNSSNGSRHPCPVKVGDVFSSSSFDAYCVGAQISSNNYVSSTSCSPDYTGKRGSCFMYHTSGANSSVFTWSYYSCPAGTVFNPETNECGSICESLAGNIKKDHKWDYFKYGDSPTFCSQGCALKPTGLSLCFMNSGSCNGDIKITGEPCDVDGTEAGGSVPDEIPQGCELIGGKYVCPEDTNGDGEPDAGSPLDPDAECGYDGNDQFNCSGGSFADPDHEMTDPTKPLDPETSKPITPSTGGSLDVETPSDPTLQSGVSEQVKLLNEQINKLLSGLNKDNNENFKDVINELTDSNTFNQHQLDAIVGGTNKQIEIWNELKALEIQSTNDMVSAINKLDDYDEFYHGQQMAMQKSLIQAIQGLASSGGGDGGEDGNGVGKDVSGILDALTKTDATGLVNGEPCKGGACPVTYVSQHDNESLKNMVTTRLVATKDTIYGGILDSFGNVDLSNASRPSFTLDMSGFGFGVYDLNDYTDFSYVFLFIRVCMLFTAAMTCRRLIFGG